MTRESIITKKHRLLKLLDGWLGLPADDPIKEPVRDAIASLPNDESADLVAHLEYLISFLELSALRRAAAEHLMATMTPEEQKEFIQNAQSTFVEHLRSKRNR